MRILCSFLAAALLAVPAAATIAPPFELKIEPTEAAQGAASMVRLEGALPSGADYTVLWDDEPIALFQCPKVTEGKGSLCGVLAVPHSAAVGNKMLSLIITEGGNTVETTTPFRVRATAFRKARLRVARKKATPPPEVEARIEMERRLLQQTAAGSPAEALCTGNFTLPVDSRVTAPFGEQRVFNNKLETVHLGLDLRANERTDILSANSGRVVLARNMYYAGRLVVIDHGNRIFTGYAHLSRIGVEEGQAVERGQFLGKAGRSGRVTGPHLHWTMRVGDVLLDPRASMDVVSNACRPGPPGRGTSSVAGPEAPPVEPEEAAGETCVNDEPCSGDEIITPAS